jgi:hypothetical protein
MFGKELNVKREGFELVYRASGSMEAEVIKGRLEASGIPALLDSESHMLPFVSMRCALSAIERAARRVSRWGRRTKTNLKI